MRKIVVVFLILGVFLSCASAPEAESSAEPVTQTQQVPDVSQLAGKWLLSSLAGNPFTQNAAQKEAFIQFDVETMQVSGNSSINQFGGVFTVSESGKFTFSPMRSTLMAGLNMETENALYQAFPLVTSYVVAGNVLSLLDDNGTVLIEYTRAL